MPDRRQRDKDQTVQDVIAAARRLFSQKGLHGTSLRDIEAASGVSKGLILHHFQTKENLYAAVQESLSQEYTAWMAAQRQTGQDLREMITATIREALAYARTHDEFRRIALWSYLEGQEGTTESARRFTASLIAGMRAGQEAGLVRDDIDAFLTPFIVKGALDYWLRAEALRSELSAETQHTAEASDDDLVDALVRLLRK
jgi:TetR/AcrR family transcriptional regulator